MNQLDAIIVASSCFIYITLQSFTGVFFFCFSTIVCGFAWGRMISSDVSEGRSASVISVNEFGSEASSNYPEYGGNTLLQNAGKI